MTKELEERFEKITSYESVGTEESLLYPISYPESKYELDEKKVIEWVEQEIIEAERRGRDENEKSKNDAYHERDMLVCALTKLFPAYLARHSEEEDWEDDWRWIVYIDLPTGQVSWHIHDSERAMFNHLEVKENNWDGHNTQRKYERLQALGKMDIITLAEKRGEERAITYISEKEGWEESEDHYREHFGLPTKYKSL